MGGIQINRGFCPKILDLGSTAFHGPGTPARAVGLEFSVFTTAFRLHDIPTIKRSVAQPQVDKQGWMGSLTRLGVKADIVQVGKSA